MDYKAKTSGRSRLILKALVETFIRALFSVVWYLFCGDDRVPGDIRNA